MSYRCLDETGSNARRCAENWRELSSLSSFVALIHTHLLCHCIYTIYSLYKEDIEDNLGLDTTQIVIFLSCHRRQQKTTEDNDDTSHSSHASLSVLTVS